MAEVNQTPMEAQSPPATSVTGPATETAPVVIEQRSESARLDIKQLLKDSVPVIEEKPNQETENIETEPESTEADDTKIETEPDSQSDVQAKEPESPKASAPDYDEKILIEARKRGIPTEFVKENWTPGGLKRWYEQVQAQESSAKPKEPEKPVATVGTNQPAQIAAAIEQAVAEYKLPETLNAEGYESDLVEGLTGMNKHFSESINKVRQEVRQELRAEFDGKIGQILNYLEGQEKSQQETQVKNILAGMGEDFKKLDHRAVSEEAVLSRKLRQAMNQEQVPLEMLVEKAVYALYGKKLVDQASQQARNELDEKIKKRQSQSISRAGTAGTPKESKQAAFARYDDYTEKLRRKMVGTGNGKL